MDNNNQSGNPFSITAAGHAGAAEDFTMASVEVGLLRMAKCWSETCSCRWTLTCEGAWTGIILRPSIRNRQTPGRRRGRRGIESKARTISGLVTSCSPTSGWREYFISNPKDLRAAESGDSAAFDLPGSAGNDRDDRLGGLNWPKPKPGETVFISGAAGAVGSAAGQLAKQRGCRVIGSAGSPEKIRFLLEECGFDVAFNYKTASNLKQLEETAPEGIDVYFDNVGGEALEAALAMLKVRGRIAACGAISLYNSEKPQPGPSNLFQVVVKRLTMRGFIVSDWLDKLGDFQREAGELLIAGKLKHKETLVEGIESAADAFLGLFKGANMGEMVVKLGM